MPGTTVVVDPINWSPPKWWGPGYFWDITNGGGGSGPGNIFIDFIAHDETTIIEQQNVRVTNIDGSHSGIFKVPNYLAAPTLSAQHGEQGFAKFRVFSDNSSITTTTSIPIQIDMQTGVTISLQNQLQDMIGNQSTILNNTNAQQTQWSDYMTITIPSLQDMLNALAANEAAIFGNQQDTQIPILQELQANWAQYTAVTLPDLSSVLANITSGISATVTTAAGAIGMTLGEIFSGKAFDLIGSDEVTSGPTCDPVDWTPTPGTVLFGIFIHCTTIPEWYAFTAPGGGWTQRDLAVVQVFRDEEVLWRQGIHTPTWMLYPMPGEVELPLRLNIPATPPEFRVTVDWGVGVCGQLWGMTLP